MDRPIHPEEISSPFVEGENLQQAMLELAENKLSSPIEVDEYGVGRPNVRLTALEAAVRYALANMGTGGGGATASGLPHLPVFNVENYGAVADNETNCRDAIQNAIDALTLSFLDGGPGGILLFPSFGTYFVTGSLHTDDQYYTLIKLPHLRNTGTRKMVMEVHGPGKACVTIGSSMSGFPRGQTANVRTDLAGLSYSDQFGWPSLFGFKEPKQLGMGDTEGQFSVNHSVVNFYWQGVTIQAPLQPSFCALDCAATSSAILIDYCAWVDNAGSVPPANPTGLGFRPSRVLNNVQLNIGEACVWGFYGGLPVDEHQVTKYSLCIYTKVAYPILNPYYHAAIAVHWLIEASHHVIAGLNPRTGATDIPGLPGINPVLTAQLIGIEDDTNGDFYPHHKPLAHILDANNALRGLLHYSRNQSGARQYKGLAVTGGGNVLLHDLNDTVGHTYGDGTPLRGAAADTPGQPGGVGVQAIASGMELSWMRPRQGASPITDYAFRVRATSGTQFVEVAHSPTGNVTKFLLTGLLVNQQYEVTFAAVNASGTGPFSGGAYFVFNPSEAGGGGGPSAGEALAFSTTDNWTLSNGTYLTSDRSDNFGNLGATDKKLPANANGRIILSNTGVVGGAFGFADSATKTPKDSMAAVFWLGGDGNIYSNTSILGTRQAGLDYSIYRAADGTFYLQSSPAGADDFSTLYTWPQANAGELYACGDIAGAAVCGIANPRSFGLV